MSNFILKKSVIITTKNKIYDYFCRVNLKA